MRTMLLLSAFALGGVGCAPYAPRDASLAGADAAPVPASSRAGPAAARSAQPDLDPFRPHPYGTSGKILTPVLGGG